VVERAADGAPIRTNLAPLHGQMTVKLTYDHGVPVHADTMQDQPKGALDNGLPFTFTYQYRPDFAGGRFPVEIDVYYCASPGRREKSFTIRAHDLELAPGPIPIADFGYRPAMNRRQMRVDVWTNGMRYRETPNGLVKPPSLEELAAGDTRRFQTEANGPPAERRDGGTRPARGDSVRDCSPGSPSQRGLTSSVFCWPSLVWPSFYGSGGGDGKRFLNGSLTITGCHRASRRPRTCCWPPGPGGRLLGNASARVRSRTIRPTDRVHSRVAAGVPPAVKPGVPPGRKTHPGPERWNDWRIQLKPGRWTGPQDVRLCGRLDARRHRRGPGTVRPPGRSFSAW